ncbi:HlyD family type I secretion periplasmic adaptor subunit [Shewanella sp. SR43-4]|jgi:adhesin transport system membrane fusion protein|uniref:Membrane fusion protein (MFP) family protein n=1 Tax=Shewanella vesiculosa TaxID=518738 RepID=A0ABV0FUB2_9GAMM|nr:MULTISPECIES: HlyD family type I secretion periplasmic adaptor subunit [Shewanella]NCQ44725.1 HlyD family type I secretion periplasmic adaptor subunit [Shewanella frigidimarina]MBB1317864.1 HlyD family type I secretion periplasmic adaptor subunit [Shewanella sp. SR43-4]MBB1322435.1 HlyD family type I secretion periplasmic adaptor subunit [Shewanella sp. SR43-8]MBB1391748.1 HlyD family type I secretion periplasmic adaptor subunit [Shewanella sp. SG44-6]MBB1475876.1 HlyD family type I secreti|tara:strand:- start:455 stop:1837 length:1383 start_codon:yes stop_codon:yes gene_type:complete
MSKYLTTKDLEMVDDVYGAMMTDAPSGHRLIIWSLAAMMMCFFIWAYFSELDQVTTGTGKVIPSSQLQVIQSLDGGILQEIYVQEGGLVTKDQPLARIDDTRFRSDFDQQEQEVFGLQTNIIRMRTELDSIIISDMSSDWRQQVKITKQNLVFPQTIIDEEPELVKRQQEEYSIRLDNLSNQLEILARQIQQRQQEIEELASKISTLTTSYQLVSRELELTRPLARKGIVPEVELLKLERTVNDIQGELQSVRLLRPKVKAAMDEAILKRRDAVFVYATDLRAQLNEMQTKLSRMNQAQKGAFDKVSKAVITSPVIGTIKKINFNTLGGVVQPGEDIMEIVPSEDKLLIETKIIPKDIAFLHPGLPAIVKVTAYDFTRYGGLKGTVEHISADTSQDDEGNSFYIVKVRTQESSLMKDDGTEMPIIPGMLTSVDVITGKRSILEYILNPILRAKDTALRER